MSDRLVSLVVELFVKPGLVFALAATLAACLRHQGAALRHRVWAASIVAALSLPVLRLVVPPLSVTVLSAVGFPPRSGVALVATPGAYVLTRGDVPRGIAAPHARNGVDSASNGASVDLLAVIEVAWILGIAVLALRLAIAYARAQRIAARTWRDTSERLARWQTVVTGRPAFGHAPQFHSSREVSTPAVVGIVRPLVILPESSSCWSDEDLDAVLTHELAHVERRDTLFAFAAQIACVVYWCNPLVWVAAAAMTREAERACDDRVVNRYGSALSYATLLLRLVAGARADAGLSAAAMAMARPSELETRLVAVLDPEVCRDTPSRWMSGVLAGTAVVVATALAAIRLDATPTHSVRSDGTAPSALSVSLGPEADRRGDSLARPESERIGDVPTDARVQNALVAALAGPDSVLAAVLRNGLSHRPTSSADLVHERSAWVLALERNGELVTPLRASLTSRDWRVQAYAAWALAYARDAEVEAALAPLLDHPVWRVRAMAASVLRGTRSTRAQQAYERALHDDAWQVRAAAVEHFAALGDAASLERLRPLLRDRHIAVRRAVADALAVR